MPSDSATRDAADAIRDGFVELAKAIQESKPCRHKWSKPDSTPQFLGHLIQECEKCGEVRVVM